PIFQVTLAYEQERSGRERGLAALAVGEAGIPVELGGLPAETLHLPGGGAQVDLTVFAAEVAGRLTTALRFNSDLFDGATAARMAGQLATLLAGIVDRPAARLSELPLLTAPERQELLDWNATAATYPEAGSCLHELIAVQAARAPDATAVVFENAVLSYGELVSRAGLLAGRLRRLGVGPEVPVGICLERSLELVVGLLAILTAGGAYVPLDPSYPRQRLALMLKEALPPVVLVQAETAALLPSDQGCQVVFGRGALEGAGGCPDSDARARPENLAYVIYTSGSTGRPKGVEVRHDGVVNLLASMAREPGLTAADTLLAVTTVSFDIAGLEIYLPLAVGGRVVLASRETAGDGLALAAALAASGATTMQATPATWRLLLAAGWQGAPGFLALCGGEALPLDLARDLLGRVGSLWNVYGPTETTIWSTQERMSLEDPDGWSGAAPIGRPLGNTGVRVLDRGLSPVPVGIAGELYLGGLGVARGYRGRPDLTAERFLPDPTSPLPGARLYRTGDVVRYLPSGRLAYLGRVDHQVKVRGFRIEPGEVEAVLARHPAVRQAVVLAREDERDDRRLVAYVAASVERREDLAAALAAWTAERLPSYLVPTAFVILAALPLTPNGKVDRKALPAPEWRGELSYVPTRTPAEERLAEIFAQVLRRERVGAEEDFFTAGGHSLLAMQVVSRVRDTFGVELPLARLFDRPTVAGLAAVVESARGGAPAPVQATPGAARVLSYAQERLWFVDQYEPGKAAYNMAAALELRGLLSAPALAASLGEIVRRHEVLRTRIATAEGRPYPVVDEPSPLRLPLIDLTALPGARRERLADLLAAEEAQRPFDLAAGPLLRAVLLRLADDAHTGLVTVHHIVCDGWSLGVLVHELSALYGAFRLGRPSPLPELAIQYSDYGRWQREWLTGGVLEWQLGYWRERLAGAPRVLDLPADRPRPAARSGRGDEVPLTLPPWLGETLGRLGREHGATLFMVLLAGWDALLCRYTGQRDLLVGSPVANRTRLEVEGLIGFFVNTLVLRAELATGSTFRDLLGRVRATTLGDLAHQDLPFERLVEELAVERDTSRTPLVQVVFSLENAPRLAFDLPGLALAARPIEVETSKFDLTLTLAQGEGEAEGGLTGRLRYSRDLFDATTLERLAGHLGVLLGAAAADPELPLAALPLLTAAERHQLGIEWNDLAVSYPEGDFVHRLFAAWAARTPDAVAVVGEETLLSYGELKGRADRLSRYLRHLGVGPEALVGISARRSAEMVVGLLGILGAGGAYLPLDASYPRERLAFMLADAGVRVLLTQREVFASLRESAGLAALPALPEEIVFLDDPAGWLPAAAGGERPSLTADHPAYVIYTSGSTGQPKGVVITHRSFANRLRFHAATDLAGGARLLQKTSISFDVSLLEIFGPLLAGGSMVLCRPGEERDAAALGRQIAAERITHVTFPPSMLAVLLEDESFEGADSLRIVVTGSEPVPSDLPGRFHGRLSAELFNRYGPTECTIAVTAWKCRRGAADHPLPIGRPIARAELSLLDAEQRPVPAGVPGEIFIGGVCLARGYLRRAAETAERFVPNPLPGAVPGSRLYRSGDLGRHRPDGAVEFLGRLDGQVKIRGFRVELGEVEAVLRAHPGIADVAVVDRLEPAGTRCLVAYVVPREGESRLEAAELRASVAAWLPGYMVPSGFVLLPALPVGPSGKADRRALQESGPEPGWEEEDRNAAPAPPATPIEELLAGIWAEVLGRERVGREDSFFDLGGHSLLATRVVSRVRAAFGVELPLRRLFEQPTVAGLAGEVEAMMAAAGGSGMPPVLPAPQAGPAPLAFSQQRLWVLDRLDPESSSYNLPGRFRLVGELDVAALAASFGEIVRRHAVLRTTFAERQGNPVQVTVPEAAFFLPRVDLTGISGGAGEVARQAEADRLAAAEADRPFDLARGPLLRVTLLALGEREPAEHVMLATMHHIVSDAWSVGILAHELAALYRAAVEGLPSPLPELTIQYADYARWQRDPRTAEAVEGQLGYWRERLAGAPTVLELPTDQPRPAVRIGRGEGRAVALGAPLSAALATLSRRSGVTLFMTLLAGFETLLARHSGQDDLLVGTPVSGRQRLEVEGLIGFFVNTLVLRGELSAAATFRDLLGRIRVTTLEALAHQDLPFERLVEQLALERDLSRTPLFQVMFALQNAPRAAFALPGLVLEARPFQQGIAKFDLVLNLFEGGMGIAGELHYDRDLFDRSTISRLAAHLGVLLDAAAADPDRPLAALPLASPAEHQQLVAEWNDTRREGSGAGTLYDLFAAQARRAPEAPAVIFADESLTYRELELRARRVARGLVELGIRPGGLVAIWMRRGLDLVPVLLGILEAGAGYVPLEPDWPTERCHHILASLGIPCLVTDSFHLRAVQELQWRLPRLRHALCMDLEAPRPPAEPVDSEAVKALFDLVAERAVDRVSAAGFVSSYTGQPFSEAEVDEYRARVLGLARPHLGSASRVLEIGCGSGLLTFALAGAVARYVALDPSPATQARNRERANAVGGDLAGLELVTGFAHEIEGYEEGSFDFILMASTVQFFPGLVYLERVIEMALNLLSPGGVLLVADLMDLRRKADFRASLEELRGRHWNDPSLRTKAQLGSELYVDEDFFADVAVALPALAEIRICHRESGFDNELRFRYDVVLHKAEGLAESGSRGERRKSIRTRWWLDHLPAASLPATLGDEALAYVIFTSGSTGLPKGVAVRHRPVLNLIDWVQRTCGISPADRVLFVTSLCFDLSVYDVFGLLAAGGSIHVVADDDVRDPRSLVRLLLEEPITFWDSAPAALQQLVPFFPAPGASAGQLRLRQVFLSGDWIPVGLPDAVRRSFPAARVMSLGGATEATVWSNFFPVAAVDPRWKSIPYGRPIQNARYHVLDARLAPCPIGVAGDLYIGGHCLASHYSGDPAQTAGRFLPDPLGSNAGGRIYRTGDRARSLADGNLEFLGRSDSQVKIRG
ncbi:MAG: hypothetical protein QOJ16_309, partial [Acidobacteriota bacterium]|nr:hypothetical protein [Acidobacteriota bacterium]